MAWSWRAHEVACHWVSCEWTLQGVLELFTAYTGGMAEAFTKYKGKDGRFPGRLGASERTNR